MIFMRSMGRRFISITFYLHRDGVWVRIVSLLFAKCLGINTSNHHMPLMACIQHVTSYRPTFIISRYYPVSDPPRQTAGFQVP